MCGLSSGGIQRRLLIEASLTLEKAFELARGMVWSQQQQTQNNFMQRRPKWRAVMFRRSTHLSGSRISLVVTDVWEGTTPWKIVHTKQSIVTIIGRSDILPEHVGVNHLPQLPSEDKVIMQLGEALAPDTQGRQY